MNTTYDNSDSPADKVHDQGMDRRKHPRKELFASAIMHMETREGKLIKNYGILKDISLGGVCISLYDTQEEHLDDGEATFIIHFILPHLNEEVKLRCKAQWIKKLIYTIQVAASFTDLAPSEAAALQAYCYSA